MHNFKALPWLVVTNTFLLTVSLIVHICYLVSHLAGFLAIMFTIFQEEADMLLIADISLEFVV